MDLYTDITSAIFEMFRVISDALQPLGIPFGPLAWFVIIYSIPVWLIIFYLGIKLRRGGGGKGSYDSIKAIIASTGDVSAGMAGTKKVSFIRNPSDALIFLKIEENAVQQALTAVDYYGKQGELDETVKEKMVVLYQDRLTAVRAAMAKDEQLKQLVDTESAVDQARSDYLRKLAAMSGTQVETDTETGPPSVGAPGSVTSSTPDTIAISAGPPGGGAPGGGPPGGGVPGGGPPGGGTPSGPPSDGVPGGGTPGGGTPSGPPGAASPPSGDVPSGGKSSLQSEMLAEMERLKSLMSGD